MPCAPTSSAEKHELHVCYGVLTLLEVAYYRRVNGASLLSSFSKPC